MPPTKTSQLAIGLRTQLTRNPLVTEDGTTQRVGITCSLWLHDENLSLEDVLLDLAVFPKDAVRPGDLVEVASLRKSSAEEESAASTGIGNTTNGAERIRAGGDGVDHFVAEVSAVDGQHTGRRTVPDEASTLQGQGRGVSERQRSYVFVVKELSPELKQKYPNLQVSHTYITTEVFSPQRSNPC